MRKHDSWHVQWYLNGQKWGVKKSISLCPFWRFDNWLLFWQNKTPWGKLDRKKGLFKPLLMRKHDFWHVQWYLNGQKLGLKKRSLYDHFEGLTTDYYLAKQDPLGGGQIEKRLFNLLLMRKHDFWQVQLYLNGQKWGVIKSISVWPFWRFDNWLLFGKTRPTWGELDRKKGFINPLLMRKHDFWQVQLLFNGQKSGVKKTISLCPFWRFDN